MKLEVGSVLSGKVTGITKFGAFVQVAEGKSGLVHISEIANTYVDDVSKHLSVGQEVNVKLISIDDNGRMNLSIKQTLDPPPKQNFRPRQPRPQNANNNGSSRQPQQAVAPKEQQPTEISFEDRLKRFMQDSDSKISGLYTERRTSRRRGNK